MAQRDISADEIKRIFNGVCLEDDHLWRKIIEDVDYIGDGIIYLKELMGLMTSGEELANEIYYYWICIDDKLSYLRLFVEKRFV